ncbi:MAG: HEAT repeat domain-containing protein, partial [Verrucomicrobiaceae bacterium]
SMDSPRGVAWDASTRTLYVMHPPNLTAYHDDNNTGVANRQEDLITGLGFGLDFRGADHTTNGCRLAIDGWIYIAVGDYGAVKATGKDGRSLAMRGGGIVRVRPDGSGMERVVWNTRNILSVAISPTVELFTRDNTNDGDEWNDRLSFNPFGAQMGYPTLFKNFSDEIIPTMIDFGGGSPVGSVFIDEPALPKDWAYGFYSVEWGRNEIDLHPLTQNGATWKAETKQFMKMTRATDLDVDGSGHLYAVSWDGATFTYNGPNAGYIIRLAPKDAKPVHVPEFKKLTEAQLVETVGSPSAVWRQAAQRELLVRGAKAGVAEGLQQIVEKNSNLGARVAAIFTLKQLLGVKSHPALMSFLKNDDVREYALKALADDQRVAADISVKPFVDALADKNPRVRLQAVTGLGHLGKIEAAQAMLPLTADSDYTVAHIAVQALRWLNAGSVCLAALDSSDEKMHVGALRVLQALYDPAVIEGLIKRLPSSSGALHRGIFKTLCRLDAKETEYSDPKMWWGTRPDTSGPIYKPERWAESDKIEGALKQQLSTAATEDIQEFVNSLVRTKISFPGVTDLLLSKAGRDTASRLDVIALLMSSKAPHSDELPKALASIASTESEQPELRARAYRMLAGIMDKNLAVVTAAFARLAISEQRGPVSEAWEEFTRNPQLGKKINEFAGLARDKDPATRILGATVLVNIVTSTVHKDNKQKEQAQKSIDELWNAPDQAATLLSVIGRTHATQFGPKVREHLNNKDHVVAEAAEFALTKLGLDKAGSPAAKNIGEMKYEDAARIILATKGDAKAGEGLFLKQGCVVCHTVSEKEPPKGPMLGGIAQRYSRADLIESILKPSAKIAQGFESQYFKLKNGTEYEGFVVKEGGDSVDLRNIVGAAFTVEKGDIEKREKREKSIMPEGLVSNITPED